MTLTKQQALDLFRSDDLIGIGMEANALRRGSLGKIDALVINSGCRSG